MKSLALESIRIADSLEFNGKSLGSGTTLQVQVGTEGDSNSRVKFRIMDLRAVGTALKTVNLSSSTNAVSSLEVLDEALDTVNSGRASMGAAYNRLESAMANASESMLALTSAKSRIMDTDYAGESATMTANQIKMQASAAALGQANSMSNTVMSLI
jgi:flagellin